MPPAASSAAYPDRGCRGTATSWVAGGFVIEPGRLLRAYGCDGLTQAKNWPRWFRVPKQFLQWRSRSPAAKMAPTRKPRTPAVAAGFWGAPVAGLIPPTAATA